MTEATPLIIREAARVVLLDDRDRLLLFRWQVPANFTVFDNPHTALWITPGGGLDPGETYEQAALRELWEETGLREAELGPCVWLRTHRFAIGERQFEQRERYYLVRAGRVEVDIANHTAEERLNMAVHRWWPIEELPDARAEGLVPSGLCELLPALLIGPPPNAPVVIGI